MSLTRPRSLHPEFGLACSDCGSDAHNGPCTMYTCRKCGVDCGESGCSLHGGPPCKYTIARKPDNI